MDIRMEIGKRMNLIELKLYELKRDPENLIQYSRIEKFRRTEVEGMLFYPCRDLKTKEIIFVAVEYDITYIMTFPEINEMDMLAVEKYSEFYLNNFERLREDKTKRFWVFAFSVLFPLLGFILFFVYKRNKYELAIIAVIGAIVNLIIISTDIAGFYEGIFDYINSVIEGEEYIVNSINIY